MALTVGPIISAARDRHPAFHKSRVPDGVLARRLTAYQRELISRTADIDPSLVAQQASIVFALTPENAIGTVGVGTPGGQPGKLNGQLPLPVQEPAGSLIEEDLTNTQELVAPSVVTAATTTTVTVGAAAWVVNAYAGKLVEVTDGPGARQVREIESNTATVLTLKAGTTWETIPTVQSRIRIVAVLLVVTREMGVVTGPLLPTAIRQGYLVRLSAAGTPYIDYGKPLVARFDEGIELPPHESITGGTIRYAPDYAGADGVGVGDLEIRPYRYRMSRGARHTSWLENGALFLGGQRDTWKDVDSIDIRFVPIAPDISTLQDVLLLPDSASPCLIAALALYAGQRINGLPDVPKIDLTALTQNVERTEALFINGIGRHARQTEHFVADVWP